jgi:peptidoglycan/xylan/chitin deacetylase (PgdA/CDA1 family)
MTCVQIIFSIFLIKTSRVLVLCLLSVSFGPFLFAKECNAPGVAITFDDANVDSWFATRYLFIKYDAKATFYVISSKIDEVEYEKLRILQRDGSEIASHTKSHKRIGRDYHSDPSLIDQYISEEILPAILTLESHGLKISSFAFPGGSHNEAYDQELLNYFLFLRATVYSWENYDVKDIDWAFYSKNKNFSGVVYGVGIDNIYNNPLAELRAGMIRARDNNEVLILYGHNITNDGGNYSTTPEKLERILKLAVELGLKFYTVTELRTLCE